MRQSTTMDLNLLRVFVAIHETGSLTAAAQRLYVSQPAVSQALARLRRTFDDPLFERDGRTMQPTALASSVFPAFREALGGIDRALDSVHAFDPARSDKVFRIAMAELGEIGWLPAILRAIRSQSPGIGVEVVPMDVEALPEWLARGTVDVALTPSPVPGDYAHVLVKSQGYGVAMAAAHPRAHGDLTVADYEGADHVEVTSDSGRPHVYAAWDRAGISIVPKVHVNHITSLPVVLVESGPLMATVPDTIARGWARTWPLVVKPLPFDMPPVEVRLYRRATTHQTGALDWLFATVAQAIQGSTGQFDVIHGDASV
ncbi:MAG TPA: LysR family transcriptional regulator [Actinomycetaceae bacterium]|nr:LysR family transcriptional regulator [Actinomycetaceae bacterium]